LNYKFITRLKNVPVVFRLRRNIGIARCLTFAIGATVGVALSATSLTAAAHTMESPAATALDAAVSDAPLADAITALARTSPGCGRTGHHSTGVFKWTVSDGNGKMRSFLVQVPATYDPARAYPLSFVFHGAGGSSAQSYSWGLQNVTGASENGIFIFPDGVNYLNYGIGWDDTAKGYDLPFFDNMAKTVETYFCVDTARVFVAGFSWGADFVTALICNRGNSIRAAAANSATDEFNVTTNYLTYQGMPCPTTVHPAVRFVHAAGGDAVYPAPYFANTSKLVRLFNSCATTSTVVASSTTVMTCVSYNSCTNQVIECSFNASIGHQLPPNWAKDTWAYFSTFK
jgi:poly(3-hydroxybutyrate) depolymerase